jgi:hypothetical protein
LRDGEIKDKIIDTTTQGTRHGGKKEGVLEGRGGNYGTNKGEGRKRARRKKSFEASLRSYRPFRLLTSCLGTMSVPEMIYPDLRAIIKQSSIHKSSPDLYHHGCYASDQMVLHSSVRVGQKHPTNTQDHSSGLVPRD